MFLSKLPYLAVILAVLCLQKVSPTECQSKGKNIYYCMPRLVPGGRNVHNTKETSEAHTSGYKHSKYTAAGTGACKGLPQCDKPALQNHASLLTSPLEEALVTARLEVDLGEGFSTCRLLHPHEEVLSNLAIL